MKIRRDVGSLAFVLGLFVAAPLMVGSQRRRQ